MHYIGCKRKLLPFIQQFIQEKVPFKPGQVFCDLFAGTATVGQHFKSMDYQITSTDLLYSSYIQQYTKIALNKMPSFQHLAKHLNILPKADNYAQSIIDYLNQLNGKEGFVYQNYAPGGTINKTYQRMYYTDENAKKIDAIRQTIEHWKNHQLIDRHEFCVLLYALLDEASNRSNTTGTFNAFLKHWAKNITLRPVHLKLPLITASPYSHEVYCQDGLTLLPQLKTIDILYLDPPYVSTQYGSAYHVLETIAKYDSPTIKGISGLRDYAQQKSLFSSKRYAYDALEKIIQQNNYRHLFFSYNDEGIISHDKLACLFQQYGQWDMAETVYQRYQSNKRKPNEKRRTHVKERLYYLKPFTRIGQNQSIHTSLSYKYSSISQTAHLSSYNK